MQTSPSSEMHAIIPVVGGGERQKVPLNTSASWFHEVAGMRPVGGQLKYDTWRIKHITRRRRKPLSSNPSLRLGQSGT